MVVWNKWCFVIYNFTFVSMQQEKNPRFRESGDSDDDEDDDRKQRS